MRQASNHIPREILDNICAQNDIVEVISECGVLLKPVGKAYKGLCPFHDEKTPSFNVSPEKQAFYCFGCNAGGNVVSFLRRYDGKSFNGSDGMAVRPCKHPAAGLKMEEHAKLAKNVWSCKT